MKKLLVSVNALTLFITISVSSVSCGVMNKIEIEQDDNGQESTVDYQSTIDELQAEILAITNKYYYEYSDNFIEVQQNSAEVKPNNFLNFNALFDLYNADDNEPISLTEDQSTLLVQDLKTKLNYETGFKDEVNALKNEDRYSSIMSGVNEIIKDNDAFQVSQIKLQYSGESGNSQEAVNYTQVLVSFDLQINFNYNIENEPETSVISFPVSWTAVTDQQAAQWLDIVWNDLPQKMYEDNLLNLTETQFALQDTPFMTYDVNDFIGGINLDSKANNDDNTQTSDNIKDYLETKIVEEFNTIKAQDEAGQQIQLPTLAANDNDFNIEQIEATNYLKFANLNTDNNEYAQADLSKDEYSKYAQLFMGQLVDFQEAFNNTALKNSSTNAINQFIEEFNAIDYVTPTQDVSTQVALYGYINITGLEITDPNNNNIYTVPEAKLMFNYSVSNQGAYNAFKDDQPELANLFKQKIGVNSEGGLDGNLLTSNYYWITAFEILQFKKGFGISEFDTIPDKNNFLLFDITPTNDDDDIWNNANQNITINNFFEKNFSNSSQAKNYLALSKTLNTNVIDTNLHYTNNNYDNAISIHYDKDTGTFSKLDSSPGTTHKYVPFYLNLIFANKLFCLEYSPDEPFILFKKPTS